MLELYNDSGNLSISTRTYPLALVKSFVMQVNTNMVSAGPPSAFYGGFAPDNIVLDSNMLVFFRHSVAGAVCAVWYAGDTESSMNYTPYGKPLVLCSDTRGAVSVWICKLIDVAAVPPADFGIELYDAAEVRTFSTNTRAIPFIRSVLPYQAQTGQFSHTNVAMSPSLCAFYGVQDSPFFLYWTQGIAFNGTSYKFTRIGFIFYGGPYTILKSDVIASTEAQVPCLFIDTSRLPIPYG